jgi:hypothetical protein
MQKWQERQLFWKFTECADLTQTQRLNSWRADRNYLANRLTTGLETGYGYREKEHDLTFHTPLSWWSLPSLHTQRNYLTVEKINDWRDVESAVTWRCTQQFVTKPEKTLISLYKFVFFFKTSYATVLTSYYAHFIQILHKSWRNTCRTLRRFLSSWANSFY